MPCLIYVMNIEKQVFSLLAVMRIDVCLPKFHKLETIAGL